MTPADATTRWYMICPRCNAKAFSVLRPDACPQCGNLDVHTERAVCPWLINRPSSLAGGGLAGKEPVERMGIEQ